MSTARAAWNRARWVTTRSAKIIVDREVRHGYLARSHLRALRRLSPQLRVLGVAEDGGSTFVQSADEVITPLLLARGHFQRNDLVRAWELAQRVAPRPGAGAFLDVGANVGTTTLYASRLGAFSRIVAVEPSPDNLWVLELNVHTNGLRDVVEVVPAACGAEAGTVELMLSSVNAGDHRVRRVAELPSTHARVVEVPERTLDEITASAGVDLADIALVWVDTQGHEPSVLAGAKAVIEAGAPFVMEFWPEMYAEADTLAEHLRLISESFSGYIDLREDGEVHHPTSDLSSLAQGLLKAHHGQTDLLLLPFDRPPEA